MKGKYRVLHAPTAVGGHAYALSRALRRLGINSTTLVVSQNYLGYDSDIILCRPGGNLFLREIKRLWAIVFLLPRFDIIHYNAGSMLSGAFDFTLSSYRGPNKLVRYVYALYLRILQRFEIFYLRILGKKIFVTYFGDDARQGDFCLKHFPVSIAHQVGSGYYCSASDSFKRLNIESFSLLASKVFAVNPDLMHVLPSDAEFIPYHHIFPSEWFPAYTQDENRPLRFLHAPTNRGVKGTQLLIESLDALKHQGFKFELILVEGQSHEVACELYKAADVLVDQLYAGWYGGISVELMALGKPSVVYIRDEDLQFIPREMRQDLPFFKTSPDSLEDDLRQILLMSRCELLERAKLSRAFVERWHDTEKIARKVISFYDAAF